MLDYSKVVPYGDIGINGFTYSKLNKSELIFEYYYLIPKGIFFKIDLFIIGFSSKYFFLMCEF